MRDPIENISQLQKKLNDLQLENQILMTFSYALPCQLPCALIAWERGICRTNAGLRQ